GSQPGSHGSRGHVLHPWGRVENTGRLAGGDGPPDVQRDVVPHGGRFVRAPFNRLALPPGDHGIPQLFQAAVRSLRSVFVLAKPEQMLDGPTVAPLPADVPAIAAFGVPSEFFFACHVAAVVLTQYTNPTITSL